MNGEAVRCDGCGGTAWRSLRTPCPPDWFYLVSVDEGSGQDYYVFACSIACRQGLWKKGPGPVLPGTEHVAAMLRGETPPRVLMPEPLCPQGCGHGVSTHRAKSGCIHREGVIGEFCGCEWRPGMTINSSPVTCDHANECPQTCPCQPDCYCRGRTCPA